MRRAAAAVLLLAACVRPGVEAAPGCAAVVVRPGAPRPEGTLPVVEAEVAATRALRERGLSGRDRLGPDAGMLFVYGDDAPRRYWMKDCRIALDIAFLRADGAIARVATLPPGEGKRGEEIPAAECRVAVRYVLETNGGWFARKGLREGDRIDVGPAVAGVFPE